MVRFVHTSDWQLGMTRHFLEGEAQARYTAARIDAIRSIGAVARAARCEFVVVAGDVFESSLVASQTVRRALEAMAAVELPIYLLPGNHDPLDAVTVYRSRLFESLRPPNVHVLQESGIHEIRPGVELVAAPWRSKAPLSDLVGEVVRPLEPAPDGTVRIVVGTVRSTSSPPIRMTRPSSSSHPLRTRCRMDRSTMSPSATSTPG